MSETLVQGSLFGDAPETIERLLILLMPPPEAAQAAVREIERSRADHGLAGKAIDAERLHVTLIHIGDYAGALPPGVVADAARVLETIAWPAFDVTFDRKGSFAAAPGRAPHVLLGGEGLDDLRAFRRHVWSTLARAGVKMLSRPEFNPHVTLAYGKTILPEAPIAPVTWRVTEATLVHSEYGRTVYNTLARRTLG